MRERTAALVMVFLATCVGCSSSASSPADSGQPSTPGPDGASSGPDAASVGPDAPSTGPDTATAAPDTAAGMDTGAAADQSSSAVDAPPVNASPACQKFCACMAMNCADKKFPLGCLQECAAQKNWDLGCRQNMCDLVPAQPGNDHCTHAMGVNQCLDMP